MNFQNLNSVLVIIFRSFLSLKILSPIKVIFFIFAFFPKSILKTISTRLLSDSMTDTSIDEL